MEAELERELGEEQKLDDLLEDTKKSKSKR